MTETRLFLLARTALGDALRLADAPKPGDMVVYLRRAQDPTGVASLALEERGAAVIFGSDLLDRETVVAIDRLGTDFMHQWFMNEGEDVTRVGGVSIGVAYAMETARQISPRFQIYVGEILRRLIDAHPEEGRVLSDLEDGDGIFRVEPTYLPLGRLAAHVASSLGRAYTQLEAVNPIPPCLVRPNRNQWGKMVLSLLGGLRPAWLYARLRFHYRRVTDRDRQVFYIFGGRGQDLVARHLAETDFFQVVTSAMATPRVDSVRYDHLMALPKVAEVRQAKAILRYLRDLPARVGRTGAYVFEGIDYGPHLARSTASVIESQIWAFLVILAQSRKLQRVVKFGGLLVNGGGAEPMGVLLALNRGSDRRLYLLPHGMNIQKYSYLTAATDHPHVTYLAYGDDHADYYQSSPEKPAALRKVTVGNPLTSAMNTVRQQRPTAHGKRLLILSFGHLEFWNAARVYACDRYYIDVFTVVRDLIAEGWSISLRSHATHLHSLEQRLATEFGIDAHVRWDDHPTLQDALVAHDVVVSNLTSAYYQSLYAGWPTIFYEPDYRNTGSIEGIETDTMLTGLPVATDIERPVTNDPNVLGRMIRETLDADSPTSTFPKKFVTRYAERFIGPRPSDADVAIAEFIEQDFFGKSPATGTVQAEDAA